VQAQFRLGFLYAYGRGVDRDDLQAADWYGRAAAQGNRAAQGALDELRAEGRLPTPGGSRDTLLLRSAADRGGATAQYQLGVRYATGEGVAQDGEQAVYWYRLAAEQGIAPAQYQLGLRYANGDGVSRDYAEAVKWYRRAAEQGVAFAQFNLGVRYVNGQGVARDPVQAYQWFSVAARSLLGKEADTARQARDSVKAQLSPEQLARGEELVRSWRAKTEATSEPVATPRR
jgi:TPR repeat protein